MRFVGGTSVAPVVPAVLAQAVSGMENSLLQLLDVATPLSALMRWE